MSIIVRTTPLVVHEQARDVIRLAESEGMGTSKRTAHIRTKENDTHQLATLLNCSSKFLGRKVIKVYLEVITWFVA